MRTRTLALMSGIALLVPAIALAGQGVQKHFERFDVNGDGRITAEEINQQRTQRFTKADADADGVLNLEELKQMIEQRRQARLSKLLARYDADGNGKVTAGEFASAKPKWFEKTDANGDGVVTLQEMKDNKGKGNGKGHGKNHGWR